LAAAAGAIAVLSATTAVIAAATGTAVTIGIVVQAGTVTAMGGAAAPSGCSRATADILPTRKKPPDSGGFFALSGQGKSPRPLLDTGGSLC
jgi:hypothetical protein